MCQRNVNTKHDGTTPDLTGTTEAQDANTAEIVSKDHNDIIRAVYRVVLGSTTVEIVNKDHKDIIRAVYRVVLSSTTAEIVSKDHQNAVRVVWHVVLDFTRYVL